MQVKKFEAKTMKEALIMVKRDLGPEAIILSAKDNGGGFGLLGQGSVEVTAAVSETTLRKKKAAEKKMAEADRQKFQNISARNQKKFIDSVFDKLAENEERRGWNITERQYIDIDDEGQAAQAATPAPTPKPEVRAAAPAPATYTPPRAPKIQVAPAGGMETYQTAMPAQVIPPAPAPQTGEVAALKSEINRLNKVIQEFQNVPQSFITVHPGAEKGVSYEFSAIYEKLQKVGVEEETILDIISSAKREMSSEDIRKKSMIDAYFARKILDSTRVSEDPMAGRVHVFMGASGQGKTSSLVKFASQLVLKEKKKVAILTADVFKIGAVDQLKIFANILNVPFAIIKNPSDWRYVLEELQEYDHLLLDFPALSLKDVSELDTAHRLLPPAKVARRTHFVASAASKSENIIELGRRYKALHIDDVIFTRLDESTQHGLVYDFQRKFQLPLHSFGIGSKIPEDFEYASRERVLDLLFKLSKMRREV